jgi:uncharacterized protein
MTLSIPVLALATLILMALIALCAAWLVSGRMLAHRSPDPALTPADFGLRYEAITFSAQDGVRLGGRLTGEGGRPVVIICAGMFGSMDGDTALVPMFVAAGLDVFQFDWRAHGQSAGRRGSLGLHELRDVQGALDYLEGRGAGPIGLMGLSFGGAVALRAAAQDRRVACVACDSAVVQFAQAVQGLIAERAGAQAAAALRPWIALVLWLVRLRLGQSLDDAGPLGWVGRIAPRPVLLVQGALDPLVPVVDQDALFSACGEPKSLWWVRGAGHRQAHQLDPQEYQRRVAGFFAANLPTG